MEDPERSLDIIVRRAQRCIESLPVVILGSGASAPYEIPTMPDLAKHLLEYVDIEEDPQSEAAWAHFRKTIEQHLDLEQTLQKVHLTESLLRKIIYQTWKLINTVDRRVYLERVIHSQELILTRLIRHLMSSTVQQISVITTNYDRLAEYAAAVAEYPFDTHFANYGLLGVYTESLSRRKRVRILKVHGSLDWFRRPDGKLVAIPLSTEVPEGFLPMIVPPGQTKYQTTHQDPFRSVIVAADQVLKQATAYLCIGFGFNDDHIQPKLMERITNESVPIVILAKRLSEKVKRLIKERRLQQYLALEEYPHGTNAYSPEFPDGIEIPGYSLWNLEAFLENTI